MNTFAKRFKELRELMGWTQEQAAKELGIARSTIAGYEVKNKIPRREKLNLIADRFKVSVDYLIGRIDEDYSVELIESKIAYDTVTSNFNEYLIHLIKVFETLLDHICLPGSDEINQSTRIDVLNASQYYQDVLYEDIFSNANEIRAVFYASLSGLDVIKFLYDVSFHDSNPIFKKYKTYVELTDNISMERYTLSERELSLIERVNSDEDLIVSYNPTYDYFLYYKEISEMSEEQYNSAKDNIPQFVEGPEINKRILKELEKIRKKGKLISINKTSRVKNALIFNKVKTRISEEEAEYLAGSLELYRKQKNTW